VKWYFKVLGGHTHVRVFMNGAKCGDLRFRNEEFRHIMFDMFEDVYQVVFIDETPKE
jgi:hypothetical protein